MYAFCFICGINANKTAISSIVGTSTKITFCYILWNIKVTYTMTWGLIAVILERIKGPSIKMPFVFFFNSLTKAYAYL